MNAAYRVASDAELHDLDAVVRREVAFRQARRGDRDVMPLYDKPFSNLAHDLLHPAHTRKIELATEQ
ncbi:hypothetical protein D3C87_1560880 [compost metagenome]